MKTFLAVVFAFALAGCGAGAIAQKSAGTPPPSLPPDRSGTYKFTMQGYANGTASASLTFVVTITQTQWVNGVNALTLSAGTISGLCSPFAQPPVITEAEFTAFPNMPEKLIITSNFADITSPDFSKFTGTWTPESDLPSCGASGASGGNWTATKQ